MPSRRHLLGGALAVALAGCPDDRFGPWGSGREEMAVELPAFDSAFPSEYTCDGRDVSPPVAVSGVPAEAEALALVLEDPDAPTDEPFVHWLCWNVTPDVAEIPEDLPRRETVDALDGAVQGTNGFGEVGYRGPCPPAADGAHGYEFSVHALDARLSVEPGADRSALEDPLADHEIDAATAVAEYDR